MFYQGFTQFSTRNGCLAASDHFHMFTQSIKFYTLYYHVLFYYHHYHFIIIPFYYLLHSIIKYRCLKNVIHQIDSKYEWLLLSASFTAKVGLVFVLALENAFS